MFTTTTLTLTHLKKVAQKLISSYFSAISPTNSRPSKANSSGTPFSIPPNILASIIVKPTFDNADFRISSSKR